MTSKYEPTIPTRISSIRHGSKRLPGTLTGAAMDASLSPAEPLSWTELPLDSVSQSAVDIVGRAHQIYPVLKPAEIARLRRFGVERQWAEGEMVFRAGASSPGMVLILSGGIACTRADGLGQRVPVVQFGPGQFSGEVAQLTG